MTELGSKQSRIPLSRSSIAWPIWTVWAVLMANYFSHQTWEKTNSRIFLLSDRGNNYFCVTRKGQTWFFCILEFTGHWTSGVLRFYSMRYTASKCFTWIRIWWEFWIVKHFECSSDRVEAVYFSFSLTIMPSLYTQCFCTILPKIQQCSLNSQLDILENVSPTQLLMWN